MPAKSKAQQQAAGAELSRRRKGQKKRKFKSMPTGKLRHLAKTKHKSLPRRKGNARERRRKGRKRKSRRQG